MSFLELRRVNNAQTIPKQTNVMYANNALSIPNQINMMRGNNEANISWYFPSLSHPATNNSGKRDDDAG